MRFRIKYVKSWNGYNWAVQKKYFGLWWRTLMTHDNVQAAKDDLEDILYYNERYK